MTNPTSTPVAAPGPTRYAELRLRPWHRWRAVTDTWMGLPVPPGDDNATSLHLTRRAARKRLAHSRRYGLRGHLERITR